MNRNIEVVNSIRNSMLAERAKRQATPKEALAQREGLQPVLFPIYDRALITLITHGLPQYDSVKAGRVGEGSRSLDYTLTVPVPDLPDTSVQLDGKGLQLTPYAYRSPSRAVAGSVIFSTVLKDPGDEDRDGSDKRIRDYLPETKRVVELDKAWPNSPIVPKKDGEPTVMKNKDIRVIKSLLTVVTEHCAKLPPKPIVRERRWGNYYY